MLRLGHPDKSQDGLRKLYDEVISADSELKQMMQNLPMFFRPNSHEQNEVRSLEQQKSVLQLALAHKVRSA